MTNQIDIYLPRYPGDLVTAEDWNELQQMIKSDIHKAVEEGVSEHTSIEQASNADKLGGKTIEEITEEVIEKAMAAIPARTGYLNLFKELILDEEAIIKHDLKACPLVDIYQLDYFEVVCAVDKDKTNEWVTFYLYHTSEKQLRNAGATIMIEPKRDQPYKVAFSEMLDRYNVEYNDDSSFGDVENEFWKAFLADPNDPFVPQYCHSPWFEHCCREERTVASMKRKGDWNDLWFQMRPRKTVNYPSTDAISPPSSPAPTQVAVNHYDFNTLGVTLLGEATPQPEMPEDLVDKNHLKVMLLMKV